MMRWGDKTEDGTFSHVPFGAVIEDESTFGGYTMPSRVRVGCNPDSDKYFEFFQATIEEVGD